MKKELFKLFDFYFNFTQTNFLKIANIVHRNLLFFILAFRADPQNVTSL